MVKLRHKPISNQRSIIPRSPPSWKVGTRQRLRITDIRVRKFPKHAAVGRCPPEDIGGAPGYAEYLDAIGGPVHRTHTTKTA